MVYAESSAVVAWLLEQEAGQAVARELAQAAAITCSAVTVAECYRVVAREAALGRIGESDAFQLRRLIGTAAGGWAVMEVTAEVLERAGKTFPAEPVRTLDALHLATAELAHQSLGALTMLSLDQRVRRNAEAMGLLVAP